MARKPDDRFDDDEALVVENLGAKLRRTAGRRQLAAVQTHARRQRHPYCG